MEKEAPKKQCNGSQVQGSTFSAASDRRSGQFDRKRDSSVAESHTRVRDKDKIEDPKFSKKMPILPNNCQCTANFEIGNDEAGRYSHKYASKMDSGDKNGTLNP